MSKKRKQYSAEYKTKVVLELLRGDLTVAQVASKYDITAKSLGDWKKQFLENNQHIFHHNAVLPASQLDGNATRNPGTGSNKDPYGTIALKPN